LWVSPSILLEEAGNLLLTSYAMVVQSQPEAWFAVSEKAKTDGLKKQVLHLPPLEKEEVQIEVMACGVCHSDLHLIDNDWEMSRYPFVPGHEIIGRIMAKGS